jgi:hypothetical protein
MQIKLVQVKYPLCEMFWNYVHIHNEISWGWDPIQNMQLILCFKYIFTQSEDNFIQHF